MTANSWPPIMQADAMPIMGGWSVSYSSDELAADFNARGSRAPGVLEVIVQHRASNDLKPDIDGVKYFLEQAWYKRDPRRFTRQPRAPSAPPDPTTKKVQESCDTMAWFGAVVGMINAAAASGSKQGIISCVQALQDLVKSGRFRCEKCDIFITAFMNTHRLEFLTSTSKAQDWAWAFQQQFSMHLGLPIPPREVVEAQWCWNKTT